MEPRETPTSGLRDEHRLILRMAGALEEILSREPDDGLDFDALEDSVTFIRLFADACHHGQEEDLLFPELEARGMPRDGGPIAVMLHEHQLGRSYARQMEKALPQAREEDADARDVLVNAAHGYVKLIRGHIQKEDHVLFNWADQAVAGPACRKLCEAYGAVCQRRFEGHSKGELEKLAARVLERYGLRNSVNRLGMGRET